MNTCYVIAREGVSGGTGTLSYRLLSYLHEHNYCCAYLCCENNSPQTMTMIESVVDDLVIESDLSYQSQFEKIYNKYDSYVFLTYSIDEYLAIDRLRKKYTSISRSILYVVHGYAFTIPPELKIPIIKKKIHLFYLRIKYRRLVKSLIENNSIFFMDVLSVQETEKSLKISIDKSLIHLLPINIVEYPDDYWKTISRHTPFTIGTMCRMEFPFKGYVLDLLDEFVKLQIKFDLKLYVVGDGPNGEELREKINSIPTDTREKIIYKQGIAYSELASFYSQCDLALGMGTMLLDAANYNVLALPVEAYTRKLEVGSLFLDNIEWLCIKGGKQIFSDILNKIINLTDDEYRDLVHKQYCRLKEGYSIEGFIEVIINSEIGEQRLNTNDRILYDIIRKIR